MTEVLASQESRFSYTAERSVDAVSPERAERSAEFSRQKFTSPYVPVPAMATCVYVAGSNNDGSQGTPFRRSMTRVMSNVVGTKFGSDISG